MASVPAVIAAELGQQQLNVALSTIKKSAEADQAVADILQDTLLSGPRGSQVNFRA